jgi:hypothetical protein
MDLLADVPWGAGELVPGGGEQQEAEEPRHRDRGDGLAPRLHRGVDRTRRKLLPRCPQRGIEQGGGDQAGFRQTERDLIAQLGGATAPEHFRCGLRNRIGRPARARRAGGIRPDEQHAAPAKCGPQRQGELQATGDVGRPDRLPVIGLQMGQSRAREHARAVEQQGDRLRSDGIGETGDPLRARDVGRDRLDGAGRREVRQRRRPPRDRDDVDPLARQRDGGLSPDTCRGTGDDCTWSHRHRLLWPRTTHHTPPRGGTPPDWHARPPPR